MPEIKRNILSNYINNLKKWSTQGVAITLINDKRISDAMTFTKIHFIEAYLDLS